MLSIGSLQDINDLVDTYKASIVISTGKHGFFASHHVAHADNDLLYKIVSHCSLIKPTDELNIPDVELRHLVTKRLISFDRTRLKVPVYIVPAFPEQEGLLSSLGIFNLSVLKDDVILDGIHLSCSGLNMSNNTRIFAATDLDQMKSAGRFQSHIMLTPYSTTLPIVFRGNDPLFQHLVNSTYPEFHVLIPNDHYAYVVLHFNADGFNYSISSQRCNFADILPGFDSMNITEPLKKEDKKLSDFNKEPSTSTLVEDEKRGTSWSSPPRKHGSFSLGKSWEKNVPKTEVTAVGWPTPPVEWNKKSGQTKWKTDTWNNWDTQNNDIWTSTNWQKPPGIQTEWSPWQKDWPSNFGYNI